MHLKSLFLGTAAGALAVTGAQAADLPIVQPVDYVRICDAYGEGFYFIPGTETCLRIAGRIRADYQFFNNFQDEEGERDGKKGAVVDDNGFDLLGSRGFEDDLDASYRFRARAFLYMDSRTATEFGLLRTFTEVQFQADDGDTSDIDLERAFIQFGGLTFGNTRSFYDFSDAFYGSFFFFVPEVSDQHTNVLAYTAAFGNGFSASLSVEDGTRRNNLVFGGFRAGGGPPGLIGDVAADFDVADLPHLVANLRVDQGWGSAQIMGAVTRLRTSDRILASDDFVDEQDEVTFAVGGGVNVNIPFGNGTTVGVQGGYSEGALGYISSDTYFGAYGNAAVFDAVIDDDGDVELAKGFNVHGGLATNFTSRISGTIGAGYLEVEHSDNVDFDGDGLNDDLDFSSYTVDGFLAFEPVNGMVLGAGVQYRYTDAEELGDGDALAGFFRAQRTF